MMEGIQEANKHDSYEKHVANLREPPHRQSHKDVKHPKPCEKHGDAYKTPIERVHQRNTKDRTMKQNVP
jgi:hypothetical protein